MGTKKNNKNYHALTGSLTGATMDIQINTRPKETTRKNMQIKSIEKGCLTAVCPEGNEYHYTFRENNIDEKENGDIHLYETEVNNVIAVLKKAG